MKSGGCQCGAIRFELAGDAVDVYACHCLECRKQSASAFGISVLHAPGDLKVVRGEPKTWQRDTNSGDVLTCWFCPTCGTRLWHAAGDVISVKGGSLDTTPEPRGHIWTSRKLPWVILPADLPTSEGEPER